MKIPQGIIYLFANQIFFLLPKMVCCHQQMFRRVILFVNIISFLHYSKLYYASQNIHFLRMIVAHNRQKIHFFDFVTNQSETFCFSKIKQIITNYYNYSCKHTLVSKQIVSNQFTFVCLVVFRTPLRVTWRVSYRVVHHKRHFDYRVFNSTYLMW